MKAVFVLPETRSYTGNSEMDPKSGFLQAINC